MISVLSMTMMLILVSALAGCLGGDDDNGNGNGKEEEVLANAGADVFGLVGEEVTFNASASSGPIQKFWWDVDRGNATENLTEDLVGEEVTHTYMAAGKYVVTLVVEGKGDKTSNDTVSVFIDLVETITGTLQNVQAFNQTYEYVVTDDVQTIKLTLEYPSNAGTPITVYNLDMDVYTDGQTPYATTSTQTPNPTADTQVEELELTLTGIIANQGFRVVIRWGPVTWLAEVDFTLDVEIHYRAV
jgi:hypothetical protein